MIWPTLYLVVIKLRNHRRERREAKRNAAAAVVARRTLPTGASCKQVL
jgi:hypothetical protein